MDFQMSQKKRLWQESIARSMREQHNGHAISAALYVPEKQASDVFVE